MFLSMLQGCALQHLPRAAVGPGKLVRKMTLRERERSERTDLRAVEGEKRRKVSQLEEVEEVSGVQ